MSSASEYWFYHLEGSTVQGVLPGLLEKTLAKGWRALVKLPEAQLPELDDLLWTFRDDSFLPHGREDEPMADWQPILLFLLEGADVANMAGVSRAMVMINGRSEDSVLRERQRWKTLKESGATLSYYQQNAQGRWEKKA